MTSILGSEITVDGIRLQSKIAESGKFNRLNFAESGKNG